MSNTPGTVLFVSHEASRTGAPIFLGRFLHWFRDNSDVQFRVLVGHSGSLSPEFESLGPVDSFEPNLSIMYRMLRRSKLNGPTRKNHLARLRNRLLQCDIRLIYSNTIVNGEILDFLSFLNCPVICHVHELDGAIHRAGIDNLKLVKKYAANYIAVSQAVKNNLVDHHAIEGKSIELIRGFIPASETRCSNTVSSRAMIRRELGIPSESRLVCSCGAIEPDKGPDLFLQAADKVKHGYRPGPVHFVWVGGLPEAVKRMRKQVASSSLRGMVHFIGHKLDVVPYFEACDVFLLPSRQDTFPLVMLEAALREKPTVCFQNSGGAPEFVESDAGFVVPGFDVEEMAQKVVELLSSPELCKRLGMIARQKVLDRHEISVGAPQIATIIQNALLTREGRQDSEKWLQTEQQTTTQ